MSKQMIPLQTLPEDGDLVDIAPRVATHSELVLMNQTASTGNLVVFEQMFAQFNPTVKMWEMRILANANAFKDDHHRRQFQRCLQVANDMQASGHQPTVVVKNILNQIARSPQQKEELTKSLWWSTPASKGGRPKMRRQMQTRALYRLNKSKKCTGRGVRRTRHRNRSYS